MIKKWNGYTMSYSLNISSKFKHASQNRLTITSINDYSWQIEMILERQIIF